jgi:hypothetical protein
MAFGCSPLHRVRAWFTIANFHCTMYRVQMPKMLARQAQLSFHHSTQLDSPPSFTAKLDNFLPIKDVALVFDLCVLNCRSQLSLPTENRRSKAGIGRLSVKCLWAAADQIQLQGNIEGEKAVLRIRIRDPVPFWLLDPGSGIDFFWIPNLGSQTHIFESLVTIFWVKSSIILWKLAQIFFIQHFKNKIILNFMNLWLQKKV